MIAGHVPHGLGALFAGFHEEHDGTVAVGETRLDGLTDHVVVAASHSGLLFSHDAVEQKRWTHVSVGATIEPF